MGLRSSHQWGETWHSILYKTHSLLLVQRQYTQYFLGLESGDGGAEKYYILLYPSVHIAETRQFSSRMNLDMQTWKLCMFMFAEKHLCSGARHSNPHPVTVRKLVMRIALRFWEEKAASCYYCYHNYYNHRIIAVISVKAVFFLPKLVSLTA